MRNAGSLLQLTTKSKSLLKKKDREEESCEFGQGNSKNFRCHGEGLFGPEHVTQKAQMLDLNSVYKQIRKGPWKIDKKKRVA